MRLCSIEGCNEAYNSLGYCRSHYRRLRVYGDPLGVPEPRLPTWEHGTANGYNNHHCRCGDCRAAWTSHLRVAQAGVCERCGGRTVNKYRVTYCQACYADIRPRADHGTEGGYGTGCRCDECRDAASTARRRRRTRVAA